jgi:hypothetical protein
MQLYSTLSDIGILSYMDIAYSRLITSRYSYITSYHTDKHIPLYHPNANIYPITQFLNPHSLRSDSSSC